MLKNFDELSKALDLKSPATVDDLKKLKDWFEASVSTEFNCEGDVQECYSFYQTLASNFLEKINPHIQKANLTVTEATLNNWTPLQFIVNAGLDSYLRSLKPTVEQLNTKVNGNSLLLLAVAKGNLHTTECLLSLGINPCEKITKGPPLLFSVLTLPINHDEQMIKNKTLLYKLISPYFATINEQRNQVGDNLLHVMSLFGYDELTEALLAVPETKQLAFIPNNSIHYPIHTAILNRKHQCAKLLLAVDEVSALTDVKERNSLHYAALYGDMEMVKICMPYCSVDSKDKHQKTPLILAAIAGNSLGVKELQARGANVNAVDDEKRSALHYAVESNNKKVVSELLQHSDINVNSADIHAHNPLDLVKRDNQIGLEISDLLLEHGAVSHKNCSGSFRH